MFHVISHQAKNKFKPQRNHYILTAMRKFFKMTIPAADKGSKQLGLIYTAGGNAK